MIKIALGLSYNGSQFHGWQYQPQQRTVQGALERALSAVANHPVTTICAGRTDAFVHALNQVVHFESDAKRSLTAWVKGTNTLLPKDVRVQWAKEVPLDFSARFSALSRRYHYLIYNHEHRPCVMRDLVTWEFHQLDLKAMQLALPSLIGEHDFSSFRAKECQSESRRRNVLELKISRFGRLIIFNIKANAFLYHMVRNIVGVLREIGLRKRKPEWASEVLAARDRSAAAVTAPPTGLYLVEVEYPALFNFERMPSTKAEPLLYFS